jgi:hypothetical protein
MMNNFLEIFGEYIATEKYRDMLKSTTFTDLEINKDTMSMKALLHVDAFQNIMCLKAVAAEIKNALKFKTVEFEYILPSEALTESCFPMLLKVMRVNVPQTNGFLDDIDTSFVGDVFTVNFLKSGRDICANAGADKFLENYIKTHFNRNVTVEFIGKDASEEDFLKKLAQVNKKGPIKSEYINEKTGDCTIGFGAALYKGTKCIGAIGVALHTERDADISEELAEIEKNLRIAAREINRRLSYN